MPLQGYTFEHENSCWNLDNSISINFNYFPAFDKNSFKGFKSSLCRYAEEMSASYTKAIFNFFISMLKATNSHKIDLKAASTFREGLNSETEYQLGALRAFFLSWYEYGYAGVSSEVIDYLKKLTLKCNVRGKAVITKCPYSGAYTSNEQRPLLDWYTNAFVDDVIGLDEFSAFVTLLFTGRRSVQIRYLRFCDLLATEKKFDQSESVCYEINIPRAKQLFSGRL